MEAPNGNVLVASKKRGQIWVWDCYKSEHTGKEYSGYFDSNGHGFPQEKIEKRPMDYVCFKSHKEFEDLINYLQWKEKNNAAERGQGDVTCDSCGQEFYGYKGFQDAANNHYRLEFDCHCGEHLKFNVWISMEYVLDRNDGQDL